MAAVAATALGTLILFPVDFPPSSSPVLLCIVGTMSAGCLAHNRGAPTPTCSNVGSCWPNLHGGEPQGTIPFPEANITFVDAAEAFFRAEASNDNFAPEGWRGCVVFMESQQHEFPARSEWLHMPKAWQAEAAEVASFEVNCCLEKVGSMPASSQCDPFLTAYASVSICALPSSKCLGCTVLICRPERF